MDKGDESMSSLIRAMTIEDKHAVMDMMKEFYSSDAVFSNGSEEISLKQRSRGYLDMVRQLWARFFSPVIIHVSLNRYLTRSLN